MGDSGSHAHGAVQSGEAEVVQNALGHLVGGFLGGVQMQFRCLGGLVGRVDAGEVGDLAGARLGIQALDVARFGHGQRHIDEDLDELARREAFARHAPLGAERRDEAHQHDQPGVGHQPRDLGHAPDVLHAILVGEAQVAIQAVAHVVAVEQEGVVARGVQPLLDAVVDYLPTPLNIGEVEGHKVGDESTVMTRKPSIDEPFSALAFKIAVLPFFGKLTFVRVYSGIVEPGAQVANSTKGKRERIGKLFQMHANKENPVDEARAGNIYAFIGLKDTTTGDTLCDLNDQIILESMDFPDPVIEVAIEPKTKSDQEKLSTAIQKLAEEDPTFTVKLDEETGQTVIGGMGELHLDVLVDRMKREFKVEANVGAPQVAYRETIRKPVEKLEYTHKKQTGGSGQFARVIIGIEPYAPSADELEEGESATYKFDNIVTGGRVPKEYIPSVDAGIQDAMQYGFLAGFPLVNIKATLIDGAYHEVDSSEMAFKVAGSQALKEAVAKAKPVLLEPVMAVEVTTPEEYMGEVIGDINSRRGHVQAMEDRAGAKLVKAKVPLSQMFGYVGDLRSKTQGRANYSMIFDSYAEVPTNVATEIIAERTGN